MASTVSAEALVKAAMIEQLRKQVAATPVVAAATELVPIEAEVVREKKTCATGYKWASEVIGDNGITEAEDFPVRVHEDEDFPTQIRMFIPEPRKHYVIQKDQALDILRAWEINDRVLITGPTGAGKSTLVEHLCGLVRRPFVRVNATGDMDSSMIFGQLTAANGSTVWQDGTVTEAVRYGAVLAWDEWDVTPPEIMMGMQWLLEDEGKLFLKEMPGTAADKFVIPDSKFRVVCLGNTLGQGDETGQHAGTTPQNTATLDRFGTSIKLGYLSPEHEINVIKGACPKITKKIAERLVKFAGMVRTSHGQGNLALTMSPRSLIGIAKKVEFGMTVADATQRQYLNKLNTTQRRVADELFDRVFGR